MSWCLYSRRRIQTYGRICSLTGWVFLTKSILQVVDDAEAQYLAFFAGKTVGMIRAPDSYVYPAPFNLVEIFLIAPFEYDCSLSPVPLVELTRCNRCFLSVKTYAKVLFDIVALSRDTTMTVLPPFYSLTDES